MLHSIATVSLSGTLPDKLQAAATARFDGVEIFESDLTWYGGSPREVRRIAADLGLEITLYQPFREYEGLPADRRARNLDRAERKFDVMEELGVGLLLLCSNVSADTIQEDAPAIEDLAVLAERAGRRGIRIGFEALCWGRHVKTWGHAWKLVQAVNHPSLGLLVDSFHTLALNDDPSGLAGVPGDRLFFVQMADAPRLPMDVLPWSRHFRCYPGQGEFDLAGFLAPILKSGYGGPISLEVFNDDLRAASARQSAADGARSLLYLEETTRARLAVEAADARDTAAASAAAGLFTPPAASTCHGFEFIEFAADGGSAAQLGRWLETLGFAVAGHHRSKRVTLYRQGAVNLIVNAEPDSFAQAFYLLHGPSVCAMAFRLDAASQALNRARLYRCKPFEGPIGPNERLIPAVRAPDGSLIYLVDAQRDGASIYDTDFAPVAPPPDSAAGTGAGLRIDHVSLALPDGQFDSWVLFFKAAFGFRADATFVLPDPHGLVRSKAVQSPDGSVRVPLNISQSRNTATARSVSAYSGVGVQHIALATTDIAATVGRMRSNGARFLPIPANYYEDLAAKFGLDDAFVDRLAAASILYDRDGDGEFFHAYTEPFEERFSIEVVERRAYDGYGAANAPVRLAAQAQLAPRATDSTALM